VISSRQFTFGASSFLSPTTEFCTGDRDLSRSNRHFAEVISEFFSGDRDFHEDRQTFSRSIRGKSTSYKDLCASCRVFGTRERPFINKEPEITGSELEFSSRGSLRARKLRVRVSRTRLCLMGIHSVRAASLSSWPALPLGGAVICPELAHNPSSSLVFPSSVHHLSAPTSRLASDALRPKCAPLRVFQSRWEIPTCQPSLDSRLMTHASRPVASLHRSEAPEDHRLSTRSCCSGIHRGATYIGTALIGNRVLRTVIGAGLM
jgi:hypothetical protein